jgi:hypothetical protein
MSDVEEQEQQPMAAALLGGDRGGGGNDMRHIRLSDFWPHAPQLWFSQTECRFGAHGIIRHSANKKVHWKQLHLLLSPTLNSLATWALKSWTAWAVRRSVSEDGEGGSGINQEMPISQCVSHMQQLAGGHQYQSL